ncbi:MAG: CPBP family intramembrane metalloprotease [Treponemataceae bacterium]|nr:CPBP family intramembrane metalloprotease [Treponemataceae bacterium]
MKKGFFATEFAAVLLFFVLPPLFAPRPPQVTVMHFPWTTFVLVLLALALWLQIRGQDVCDDRRAPAQGFLLCQGQCLVAFGLLMASAGLLEAAGHFLAHQETVARFLPPQTIFGWANIAAGIPCAAFYEEVLYRAYLPTALRRCVPAVPPPIREAAAVLAFALAHRYLSWLSVVHAAVAGIVLRRCLCRTGRLWTVVAAHTAYNAVMTALTFALS